MVDLQPFDVCGPLPKGVTVLEASAGTGKTFTIAALTARYVAEGMPLENLLLVSFTRMATGELRNRVRERLVGAESGIERVLTGGELPASDDVVRSLADGSTAQLVERRRRLGKAIANFDAATILTTHGFCQLVLGGLGVAGDVERDVTFVEDVGDLLQEVVGDLYVRRFHRRGDWPFNLDEAMRIGRIAIENPTAPVEPRSASDDTAPAMRRRLALAVREEMEQRKRRCGVMTYDDLLTRLRDTLADGARGGDAGRRLRARYRVVLVDEFQDTDPVQWEILRRAFGSAEGDVTIGPSAASTVAPNGTTLVLIGDPKQAIYAFRGADVYAYLDAAQQAATKATLEINWRSDQGLIDALDSVFGGVKLGHSGIAYRTVRAADANVEPRLLNAPVGAPLRLRLVDRRDGLVALTNKGFAANAAAREHIAADLAADLVRLLSSPAEIVTRNPDGSPASRKPLRPGHVAVLVRTHRHAAVVRDALEEVGVPAVINGAGSVLATPTAREWLRLLEALERPTSATRAASAALTSFLGWSPERLASADERGWEAVHTKLHRWAGVLRTRGVASLLEMVTLSEGLPGRILSRVDGERQLTDLRHLGQLLHAMAITNQMGVTALTAWLRQRIAEAAEDTDNEERSRRLESDAEAVQVLTIHRSKGLEFPVVYYPYLWEPGHIEDNALPIFHDADAADARTIDVGGKAGPGFGRHREQFEVEQRGEDLRLAYVALTRAQHQAVLWWAGSYDSRHSPLGRLLFCRDREGNVAPKGTATPSDDEVTARFTALAAPVPGRISLERSGGGDGVVWAGVPRPAVDLEAGRFDRTLDALWRRTSYSGITSGAHDARVGSEAERAVVSDEDEGDATTGLPRPAMPRSTPDHPVSGAVTKEAEAEAKAEENRLRWVPSPLAATPRGADIGTLVHSVLESTDFTAADLDAELRRRVDHERARSHLEVGDPAALVAGLRAALDTPLGVVMGGLRLRDIAIGDRINEMSFEMPLVGGDIPTAELTLLAIAGLLRRHLPADDPLAGYADRLADPTLLGDLRGYLVGSLDLVVRTRDSHGTPRFTVIDHKTNWLGPDGEELSAWHYRPATLAAEMQRAHYPLQAVLYTAALHRYLRWRLPHYDPKRNLAGVAYLFIRGMSGADTPSVGGQRCGVFAWNPPPALVEALSDVLDRGVRAA
jgi:exodeoxyribonuclease V beta subunit